MNPHYIIDGYNLIHNIPRFRNFLDSSLEHARNMFIAFTRNYLTSHKVKVTVVFDGDEIGYVENPAPRTQRLKIIYSRPPEKADPVIKRLVSGYQNKKSLFVVSADNEIILYSKQSGANVLSPEEFYHRASQHPNHTQMDQKYNSKVSPDDVKNWLKLFGENDK